MPQAASRLIPFGTLAAGGYAREAENEGADFGQQVAYGLLGGTAETVTEAIPLANALNIMKKFGAGEIAEKGAKTLIGKYGKTALQIIGGLISEGAQEGIMSPLANTAKKVTYKPDMPLSGEGGIIDLKSIGQDAYGGIAMSLILGALGLPISSAANRMVSSKIESQEPITAEFVQNELIPTIQNDTAEESPMIQQGKGVFSRLPKVTIKKERYIPSVNDIIDNKKKPMANTYKTPGLGGEPDAEGFWKNTYLTGDNYKGTHSDSDIHSVTRPGMDRARKLEGIRREREALEEKYKRVKTLSDVEYMDLAQRGYLTEADYHKYIEPKESLYPHQKETILKNIQESNLEGRGKKDSEITFEEWYYRREKKPFNESDYKNDYRIDLEMRKGKHFDEAIKAVTASERKDYEDFIKKAKKDEEILYPKARFKNTILNEPNNKKQDGASLEKEVPSQFKGDTPESQKIGIVPLGMRGNSKEQEFTYSDPELEQQHKENRLSKKTHTEKLSEWVTSLKSQFTRAHRDIEPNTQNAEIIKELVRYPKIKAITADEAARVIRDIIDREGASLSNEEYNRFERYVFLNDLVEEIEQGHELPGLWTAENVKSELDRVKASLNDNINNAVKRREQHMEKIKNEYIKAMADIGFNVKDRFKRKNYFRHQVLEYMNAQKITGPGSRVKVSKNRGFIKQRHGTQMAINEDYLQAEYEVLSNMMNDTETAKMLARIDKNYSIKEKLIKEANLMNQEAIQDIIEKEKEESGESQVEVSIKDYNKNIAIGFGRLQKLAEKGELWDGDGKYASAVESIKKGTRNASEGGKVFEYISKLIDQKDIPGQQDAALILKNVSGRKKFIQTTLGKSFATWETIIPDGYTTWQPIMGRTFFAANSITDKLAEALISAEFKDLGASDLKVKKILTMGQNLREYVIPKGIAKTLDNVYNSTTKDDSPVSKIISTPTKYWKGWVLTGNPRQVIKYNIRNLTGDLDGLIAAGGFGAISPKYSARAAKELYNAMKHMEFTPDLLEWRDKGGFQTLLYANEIADVNDLQMFRKYSREAKASVLGRIVPMPKSYFEFTRNLTDYREALMRYASYLYFKDQIKANGGKPKTYGASNARIIDGLKSIEDKAYQLSKDALGSYDEITEFGQAMRKYLIPFYSWNEVNFKRYKRIVENAVNDIKLQQAAGEKMKKSLGLAGYISGKTMLGLGKIAIRIGALSALLLAWNNLVMGDEEEELPESIRNTPHITLGKNDKGEILYFSRLGSLNDILEWFGLDTLIQDIRDLKLGRKTIDEQASDMINSPINKLLNGLTPFLKNPAELIGKTSIYPDWREPRRIRDREEYIANSLGVGDEYKHLKGLPVNESYLESWYKAFAYKSEPKANAYYRILDLKAKFEQKELKQEPSFGYSDNQRSKDLYYFKLSLKYGDKEAAKKYLKKYFVEDGGTTKGLATSLNSMSPVHGLNDDELERFVIWLTPEERKDLKKAIQFYDELVTAGEK